MRRAARLLALVVGCAGALCACADPPAGQRIGATASSARNRATRNATAPACRERAPTEHTAWGSRTHDHGAPGAFDATGGWAGR